MNAAERAEVLDRLAAGQISVTEAMRLLDQTAAPAPIESLKAAEPAAPAPVESLKAAAPAVADPDAIPVDELKAEEEIVIRMTEEPVVVKPVVVKPAAANGDIAPAADKARWLKIRVRDTATGKNKVSITLPLGMVRFALALGSRFSDDMAGMDTDELMAFFKSGERGVLVEAEDEEDNEQVQIYLD